jgi:hypothetical protein
MPAGMPGNNTGSNAITSGGSSGIINNFTPELMARVATFVSTSDSELMNVCLAVGPVTSRIIKHDYLKKNTQYLQRTLKVFFDNAKRVDVEAVKAKWSAKAGENHLAWMSINSDWKSNIEESLIEELRLATKRRIFGSTRRKNHAIDCSTVSPYLAFNNPAVAIQFGLMDVLIHLVEEKGIDVNAVKWTTFHFMHFYYYFKSEPLLMYTMGSGGCPKQIKMYKYLLGRDNIDFVGKFFDLALHSGNDFLRSLLDHPRFDVNGPIASIGDDVVTPLAYSVARLHRKSETVDRLLEALPMLLQAGANPYLACPYSGKTPLEYARQRRDMVYRLDGHREDFEDFDALIRSHYEDFNAIIRVMEMYPLHRMGYM